ncbi:MAG TPA: TIGR02996 domain-containing protein [Kofleriaceae bacterium]|nr:TIGR02996 domain-containing protein [Kofleriaceae bacterium]
MARYELGDRFWSIVYTGRAGTTLAVTSGKIGSKGKTTTRSFASAGAAVAQHDELVLARLRAGYRLIEHAEAVEPPPAPDAAAAALEASLIADSTDTAAYEVYGDWLQRQGDPRGELIALQIARAAELARGPRPRSTIQTAIGRHVERHAAALLGPLAAFVSDVRDLASGPFVWRFGFIHRVTLESRPAGDLADTLAQVLRHPSGRFVRELVIRANEIDEAHRVVDVLSALAPPTVCELELVVRAEPLELGPLWPRLARLRRIAVVARGFDVGAVRLPDAERARFATARLTSAAMRAIAVAPWPALQRLELRFGGRHEPGGTVLEDLEPLLVRTDLPALTHLKLRGCAYAGEALGVLAGTPLARQLVVIDLSHGHVERADLRALASHTTSFPQLRELWLPADIAADAQRQLAGIARHLISDARGALDTFASEVATPAP